MSRATRSKQVPILLSLNDNTKTNTRSRANKNTIKEKNIKTKSISAKELKQDENKVPLVKYKQSSLKNSRSRALISESSYSTRQSNRLICKDTLLINKSPILRDTTNALKKKSKVNLKSVKNKISLNENKKTAIYNDSKLSKNIQVLIERCITEESIIEKVDFVNNNSEKSKVKLFEKKVNENKSNKDKLIKMSKGNGSKCNKIEKTVESDIDKNNEKETLKKFSNHKIESQDSKIVKTRILRRNNISIEDLQKLLNEDEEAIQFESDKIAKNEDVNNHKKEETNDSLFILKPLENKKSIKPVGIKLRPRKNKNYCEMSRNSQNFNLNEKELVDTEKSSDKNNEKPVPIYKNIKLSQETVQDKEEIYNFPDDSQENIQGNKKRKKTTKRPAVKRVKKDTAPRTFVSQEKQKKRVKKAPFTVNFKDLCRDNINKKETIQFKNAQSYVIPEYLHDAGDSTIQEISTIKILSNEKMERSQKIDLTVTPPIPKTITSELKLFGPRNAITCQPTTQYSNMVNHSLIRKSMSPISKLVDNFDAGSPWRPIDTFSRVQQIVQSTPQINRLPLMREKKLQLNKINYNKKSISSDDTIHVLSSIENKSLNKEESRKTSTIKKNEISPRKFGSVLSNVSPVRPNNVHNTYRNPIKNSEQLSVKKETQKKNSSEGPINEENTEQFSKFSNRENNNNNYLSPKKSLRSKFSTPNPFRFDKIHSKKPVFVESQSKTQKSTLQGVNEQTKSEVLLHEKPEPIILRQSNLDDFLNIDQMPEQASISTVHGIFSDIHSTPISKKRGRKVLKELTIENAFGFDDCDTSELSPVKKSPTSKIISNEDLNDSIKENMSPRTTNRLVLSKISENALTKPILKSALKKNILEFFDKNDENVVREKNNMINKNIVEERNDNNENVLQEKNDKKNENEKKENEFQISKKSVLDSISFSDTFDVLHEKKEVKLPEEIPLFVDLEPAHFNEPPRRSYQKRKREVNFDISTHNYSNQDSEPDEPKPKKKKESKNIKIQKKKIKEWVKSINETFEEIDNYDLVVE